MVGSKERQHSERVPRIGKSKIKILPVAAIYGGNASGKSNLCKAFKFAKEFISEGRPVDSSIPVKPFQLDPESTKKPIKFVFEISIEDKIYEFGFIVSRLRVEKEWLKEISGTSEKLLYERVNDQVSLQKKEKFLDFISQSTRSNQLFLTHSVNQNFDGFKHIYRWFKDDLTVISPDEKYIGYNPSPPEKGMFVSVSKLLDELDTGITNLDTKRIPPESVPFLSIIKDDISDTTDEPMVFSHKGERYFISSEKGKLKAEKLISYHTDIKGNKVQFEISSESDGTLRLLDLLPALLIASDPETSQVFIIDELDRSLHTNLTRQVLDSYLENCNASSRSQFIFTTHDALLMDQDLLRRDEMWLIERTNEGASRMFSISDFEKVRNDKDIRKSYLSGRFGGIPHIYLSDLKK